MAQLFSNMVPVHVLLIFLFTCFLSGCFSEDSDQPLPQVQTAQGTIRGSLLTTYTGSTIYSFRGIRYAEPMTGENRFKPPIPVKPWTGEYDATKDGAACIVPEPEKLGSIVSEDCLFLNVYTKKLTGKESVVVFFHPGGFIFFTGRSDWFGPQYILNKDIVLVTINYRLGPLGFLSTNDTLLRGNYGLKDQVAVLRWVKQNIAGFGGDPDNVTIMGYSAGSASVMMHMLSPMSRGLFHKAIAMSGSATAAWAVNRDPLTLARGLATAIRCNQTTTVQQIYNCLKSACPMKMTINANHVNLWETEPLAIFAAVVEKDYGDGEERFLTDEPLELIKRGEMAPVPLIIGVTTEEFSYLPFTYRAPLSEIVSYYKLPGLFMYDRNQTQSQRNITKSIQNYFDNSTTSDAALLFGRMLSDAILTFPVVQAAKLLAEKSSQSVYMYLFSYTGRYSWHKHVPDTNMSTGPLHMDDLIYLFYTSQMFPEFNATDPENQIIDILTSTWAEFAKTGVPTLPQSNVKWAPLSPQSPQYLNITANPKMVSGMPLSERMEFWESLFPVSGPHQIYF